VTHARVRVRAPRLRGRRWLNTGGRPLHLDELRGRIVLLDFWTFCCINCLHVLDELRPVEAKYADSLVVIGVHSPKFEHEKDPDAVSAAVERYGVGHPVLDDPELATWQQYTARAWPTLVVIDPEGYVVATMAGEGHADALDRLLGELVAEYEARGTLVRGVGPYVPPPEPATELRYPGKAVLLPTGTLLVSDSAHHRLVEQTTTGEVVRRIGTGARGRADGTSLAPVAGSGSQPSFAEPQGLALLPAEVAARVGYDVVVADTANHLLRGLRLADGSVRTVAGTGEPWRAPPTSPDALAADLSSPWDVAWYRDAVVVAMAGIHQLWRFDPARNTISVYAGTTTESLRDGPVAEAFLAQPSGLASDGDRLWLVDSESSALRYVERDEMHTVVGTGLFDFGHADGRGRESPTSTRPGESRPRLAAEALLQHPLGVAVAPDGTVLVADTYNGAIRRYDPASGEVSTIATGLAEPSDVVPVGSADGSLRPPEPGIAGGRGSALTDVLVVESGAHRVVRPLLDTSARTDRYRTERPVTALAPGQVTLDVVYSPPPGAKLDDTYGPPTRLEVSADPPELLAAGAGVGTDLSRRLVLAAGSGVLQVTAQAASCDAEGDNPACHLTRQDWGVPVTVTPGAPARLDLILLGPPGT
jgi:thiol-disulfide isomerase/thioredoxin/DNA-binding beta-propeller fold protein YncE